MRPIRGKQAAIELSMTTIIVVVLSLTLLILGFVFIRSIMCGAIGVTDEIGNKVDNEVQRLFESSTQELSCVGSDSIVPITPGPNVIKCVIKASVAADYRVELDRVTPGRGIPTNVDITEWFTKTGDTFTVIPGDDTGWKAFRMSVPDDAPEGEFSLVLRATKDGGAPVSGQTELDFKITRTGVIRNVLC